MSTPTTRTTSTRPSGNWRKAQIIVWALLAIVVIAGIVAFFLGRSDSASAPAPETVASDAGQVVRDNSRVLSQAPNEKAVLVEFLDFECEACRAAYPFVEELRAEYSDTVTFVNRYFPLPGHRNSMPAAVAVEAAAQGAIAAGAKGLIFGRNVWNTDDPVAATRTLSAITHGPVAGGQS